jgi:segregation and condensation protein B
MDDGQDPELARALEAILFASDAPISLSDIIRHIGERGDLLPALRALAASYGPRGINLVERGGRWQFQTAPDLAHHLRTTRETVKKLSRAAVETLAVIAYHEPVTRPEIEEIRGVAVSGGTIDVLMAAGWVRPAGRRETPGRPLQYATTPEFLAHFNLGSRRDLPGIADLKAAGLLDPIDSAMGEMLFAGEESDAELAIDENKA